MGAYRSRNGRSGQAIKQAERKPSVPEDDAVAMKRSGRQVMNVQTGTEAAACTFVEGDSVAVVGENRKLLIFPLAEVPELARGRGVILQRYRSGGLSDAKVFRLADGLSWKQGETRTRTEFDLTPWRGARGGAGRSVPQGFPRTGRFS